MFDLDKYQMLYLRFGVRGTRRTVHLWKRRFALKQTVQLIKCLTWSRQMADLFHFACFALYFWSWCMNVIPLFATE